VRITLLLDSNPNLKTDPQTGKRNIEPPLIFQSVACLNLADASQDDTGNSADNSTQNPGDQSAPGTPNGGQN
jgi:hypothetical protein